MVLDRIFTLRRPPEERPTPSVLVRRIAAVLAIGLYPLTLLLVTAEFDVLPGLPTALYVALLVGVVALWMTSTWVVYEFRRRLAQAPDDQLDEREQTVRDEAYLISYRLLSVAVVTLALSALVVLPLVTDSRQVSLDVLLDVFLTLVIAAGILPSAVVAWRDTGDDGLADEEADVAPVGSSPANGRF